jgi:hypothetical protein
MLWLRHSIRTGVSSDVRDATKPLWALEYDDRNWLVQLPAQAEQALVGSNIFALAYASKRVTYTRSLVRNSGLINLWVPSAPPFLAGCCAEATID